MIIVAYLLVVCTSGLAQEEVQNINEGYEYY